MLQYVGYDNLYFLCFYELFSFSFCLRNDISKAVRLGAGNSLLYVVLCEKHILCSVMKTKKREVRQSISAQLRVFVYMKFGVIIPIKNG